jgi:predicted PurR-regulated permease PerM
MRISRTGVFWLVIGAAGFVAIVLLHQILLPFVAGAIGAYLLVPVADRLESFGINRTLTALGLVLLVAVALILVILVGFPVLLGEVRFFIDQFPKYLVRLQSITLNASHTWLHGLFGDEIHIEQSSAEFVSKSFGSWLDDALISMWAGGMAALSLLSLLIIAPVVTIYLVIDWHRMMAAIDGWIAEPYRRDVRVVAGEIHDTIIGFLRGQLLICTLLAAFYAIVLRAMGLEHAILLGITAGLVSFVPYLGAATGLFLATCVALVQFWPNWLPIVGVAATFIVGEMVADYVLAPRIIGRRVKLSPVWLLLALSAFGWLLGFAGLLVAVPLAASLRVLVEYCFARTRSDHPFDRVTTGADPAALPKGVAGRPRRVKLAPDGSGEEGGSS